MLSVSCGEMEKAAKGLSSQSPASPAIGVPASQTAFTPGSYFKVTKDVGDNDDTRVYEIQYLSSGRFIMTYFSFPGGKLAPPYFHRKTGLFKEEGVTISHVPDSDTCGKLTAFNIVKLQGTKDNSITVYVDGVQVFLHSYLNYFLPPEFSPYIPDAIEDVGCVKFKDN
jgi:hypothetical protein